MAFAVPPIGGRGGFGGLGGGGLRGGPPMRFPPVMGGGNPPQAPNPGIPNRYLDPPTHLGGPIGPLSTGPHFQENLHSGGRFMDMLQGINAQQMGRMQRGLHPGGFHGDFSGMSPAFMEHLAMLMRRQGPMGTAQGSIFKINQPGRGGMLGGGGLGGGPPFPPPPPMMHPGGDQDGGDIDGRRAFSPLPYLGGLGGRGRRAFPIMQPL